jgi:adenylyltransferase/sulfurtransferase
MLTPVEIKRYDRQLIMENIGEEGQERLKKTRVFLAGAGGLGSPIAFFLAAAGIGRIRIVDDGLVELSNLNRQILYGEGDLGKTKAACAKRRLVELNSLIDMESVPERIHEGNAEELIGTCDIIIDALDNYETRYLLNQVAFQKGIPLVHGAVEEFYGQVTTIIPGKTNCLKCLVPKAPTQQTWPIIGMTCGLVASIQATEAIKVILGIGALLENRLLVLDGLHARMEEMVLERNPACEICSNGEAIT